MGLGKFTSLTIVRSLGVGDFRDDKHMVVGIKDICTVQLPFIHPDLLLRIY